MAFRVLLSPSRRRVPTVRLQQRRWRQLVPTLEDIDLGFGRPHTWYPKARRLKRRIVCHVGPTNSGKTHEALIRLQEAKSGVFCGPLRLLAWEVHEKLNNLGVPCSLLTGQEVTDVEGAKHVSCTVEMADTTRVYECAVIDECQLLGDRERGWAWTRAILGLPAMELHLCGSPAFVDVVHRICMDTGDYVEVKMYERLSPLEPQKKHVKSWSQIKAGDCVVAFSRRKLFKLKNEIEVHNKDVKCCIVYGGLPPEARKEQARLFNDADSGYNVLVASDAIGMGLNLSIGRVIFSSLSKYDGETDRPLTPAEIKQIAGRAGRFQSAFEVGKVAAREKGDVHVLREALELMDDPITSVGIKPTREQLQFFAQAHGLKLRETADDYLLAEDERKQLMKLKKMVPQPTYIDFWKLLVAFRDSARFGVDEFDGGEEESLFFMCDLDDMITVARRIEEVPLLLQDRYVFCIAPVDVDKPEVMSHLRWFASQFAKTGKVGLHVDLSSEKVPSTPNAIQRLEELHSVIDVYLWLGVHFPEGVFTDMEEAATAAEVCSDLIEAGLRKMKPVGEKGERINGQRERRSMSRERRSLRRMAVVKGGRRKDREMEFVAM